jgi:exodeoxyribonuclease V beta subunit
MASQFQGLAFWKNRAEPFSTVAVRMKWFWNSPQAIHLTKQTNVIEIQAKRFPEQRFYSRGKTSFSYLAQHLKHKAGTDLLASQSNDAVLAEDELDQVISVEAPQHSPLAGSKQFFERTLAGNFLHEILSILIFNVQMSG